MKGFWEGLLSTLGIMCVILFVVTMPTEPKSPHAAITFSLVTEALIISVITVLFAILLGKMLNGQIDMNFLISEENGHASLSRFQFLVFTFVIAGSYLLLLSWALGCTGDDCPKLIADNVLQLPNIPAGVLGLIGISGGSYVIAKGTQKSGASDTGVALADIKLVSGGAGYVAGAHVDLVLTGGIGSGAKAYAVADGTGTITQIVVQAGGSGYATAPDAAIPVPAGGTAAVAKAVLAS